MVHQMGGSTTCALNLLELLARRGMNVTVVATLAKSRSPRLWFRVRSPLPGGIKLFAPGYIRIGALYFNLFLLKGWARTVSRAASRFPWLNPLRNAVERAYGEDLYTNAWDLTPPTEDERETVLLAIERRNAGTVIANYAFWAPLFDDSELQGKRRVILMHDLLSARVRRFHEAGTPLDCPEIDEETEMSWLNRADTVLAAQEREAEEIRPKVRSKVLVQPMVFPLRASTVPPVPGRCLFVGANIQPNRTGATWLLEKVWPIVLAKRPDATLHFAGTIGKSIPEGIEGVRVLGIVEELESEYAHAAVCVAPLLIGSGIKIKLLEAMSYGKATVATSVGVQGLEQWVADVVEVSDDPEGFAAGILKLLQDDALRKQREAGALELIRRYYSTEAALPPAFIATVL